MDRRCERCLKALPTDHVGVALCGPCRREAAVREALTPPRSGGATAALRGDGLPVERSRR